MIEWFENIWAWIVSNKDNVVAVVTSANFAGIVATVIAVLKAIGSVNKNTTSNNKVTTSIKESIAVKDDVAALQKNVNDLKTTSLDTDEKIESISSELTDANKHVQDLILIMEAKLNSLLEVQQLVYSTIKDESIRKSVLSIIANAKNCVTDAKSTVTSEMQTAKIELEKKLEEFSIVVNEVKEKLSTKDVSEELKKEDANSSNPARY